MAHPRILLVTPWAPYPFDGGSKRILSLATFLADRFRFSLLTTEPLAGDAASAADDIALEHRFLRPVFDEIIRVPRNSSPPDPTLPDDVARWRMPALDSALRRLAPRFDLVHCEFELTALSAEGIEGSRRMLTLHDMGSFRREDLKGTPADQRREKLRRRRFVARAVRSFDKVIVMTEPDRRRLLKIVPDADAVSVPTGVDLQEFPERKKEPRLPETLAFVGHYPHFPNEDAVLWFLTKIWPTIRRRRPRARFLAVGSRPTEAVLRAARDVGGVDVTGTVDSVSPWLARAHVFVAPMRLGEGIKGKILEAFAVGVPVVATRRAAKGLGAVAGTQYVAADTAAAFSTSILRLFDQSARRRALSRAGRLFAETKFDWRLRAKSMGDLYDAALAGESK